ncbi:PTR2-domain-containing protein [Fomitiporia mediterranea MF3/22]|uniref:PTR2-domain-containing protein n=1 Tax=Fomitiporia mediterranea (strain MF3/22) TaxID=694068 RepID=UPI0004407C5C|nr:PTR2-domain-containing protein [Fomitiporia mediterranea MF3/22]EJD02156.1 PTR2-domain-containing protein [Fomitiporia mediterranea MF3/22]
MLMRDAFRNARRWLTSARDEQPTVDYIPLANTEPVTHTTTIGPTIEAEPFYRRRSAGEHEVKDDLEDTSSIEYPSQEDNETLRKISDDIPLSAFIVVIVELCERMAFYGLAGVFQNYLQNPLPPGGKGTGAPASVNDPAPAGALNLGQSAASGLQQTFTTFAYIFPLFGAIIADTKWGRYKTITVFCVIYFLGLLTITITSFPSSLKAGLGLPGWLVGAFILALGTGGIKANISPLVADQYRRTSSFLRITDSGERVVVDPTVTISRMYNLFYWCINVGSLFSIVTTQLERRVGFWAAFALPTCIFLITPCVLASGSRLYYKVPPQGSVLLDVFRVVRIALRGFLSGPSRLLRRSRNFSVWDKAKPSFLASEDADIDKAHPILITWDDAFVDEVKSTATACQIALFLPLFWISYNQLATNLISMGATMTMQGTPNDLLGNFNPLALIILIPFMDIAVYPSLRRAGIVLQPIFRIWLGFMFASLAMVYSAILQYRIYHTNPCGEFVGSCAQPSTISIWMQVLIAIAEIFASITSLEYAYNMAPKRMKSVVMSVFLLTSAVGSMINALLAPFVHDPNLVKNYAGIALVTFFAGNIFYLIFRHRDSSETDKSDEATLNNRPSEDLDRE